MPERDDFYVGYLPTPAAHSRAVRVIVPALLWACALLVAGIAWTQRNPGDAQWSALADGKIRTWTGTYRHEPYPMLEAVDDAGKPAAYPIVRQGKLGAPTEFDQHDGKRVWVEGWSLERQGRTMIELAPDEGFRRDLEYTAYTPPPEPEPLGPARLRGEIVDSKCFLGAMKPGDGKAHRACATLCIDGGIPPSLITYDDGRFVMLVTEAGESAAALVRPFVAQPVTIIGELERRGDLLVLRVGSITRVSR